MIDLTTFGIFFAAAFTLAVIPGPGMLYVLARTVRGGKREGILSTLGTGVAGLLHTLAAASGISAVLATSAVAFAVIKWLGAAYLIYLGVRTLLEKADLDVQTEMDERRHHPQRYMLDDALQSEGVSNQMIPAAKGAFTQGILTEVLNPKTALFFLAFIPQFVNPAGHVFLQFVTLGFITTLLTSGADFVVVWATGPLSGMLRNKRGQKVQRFASGGVLIGLGVYVAVER